LFNAAGSKLAACSCLAISVSPQLPALKQLLCAMPGLSLNLPVSIFSMPVNEGNKSSGSPLKRRDFIKQSTILGGGILLTRMEGAFATAGSGAPAGNLPWYQQPLTICQTVLRETDAKDYDAAAVVGYLVKTGCNVLVINAGGIVDFFQNPLPAANVNPFMKDRDLLKEITSACKAAGIRVIARVDFRGVEEKVFRQFPSWFSVDADQRPLQLDYTRPKLYAACYTGHYRNDHAEAFIGYLMKHYALDGIWHNSIGVGGICYCSNCRNSFGDFSGKPIPLPQSPAEDLDQYMVWKSKVADKHMERMKIAVKAFGADKIYSAEVFGMFESGNRIHSGIDLYNAREHFDFLVSVAFLTENTDHIRYQDLSYANTIIRFLKSMAPEKEAIILYGGNGTADRYVIDPPLDLKIWLWEALAAGGRFWNCYFTGPYPAATHDRRNAFNHTGAYLLVRKYKNLLEQQVPVANVGIYYSRPTRLFYREKPEEGDSFEGAIKGMEGVLTEHHIPYHFLPDDLVTPDRLKQYKLVILPNVRCLSAREAAALKTYVFEGGTIISTYASSLHDENGKELTEFALSEVFGVSYSGKKMNTRRDCYQYITSPHHPLVEADSGSTELLANGGYTLLCKPARQAVVICTLVPAIPNQPPEKAWVDKWSTEFPTVVFREYGKGKSIYFANQPDQLAGEMGHPDFRNLLIRSCSYLAGKSMPLQTNAPASVHIGLTRSRVHKNQYILSFVNTSSATRRPVPGLIPVSGITAWLSLDAPLSRHKVLKSQGNCSVYTANGKLTVRLSRLEDFCAVWLELAG
jgi:hypothetical protein